jgi:hypothetical protein
LNFKIFVVKLEERFGRHWHTWEVNVMMDVIEIGCKYVVWIHLAQEMFVGGLFET